MSDADLLYAIAKALDAASSSLRQHAIRLTEGPRESAPSPDTPAGVLARARMMHPQIGPRQAQVIEFLAEVHPGWLTTGKLSQRMSYDQPNVYLTLQGLMKIGVVEKDSTTQPHQYRLSSTLYDTPRDEAG